MHLRKTLPWVVALTTGSALAAMARDDLDERCRQAGQLPDGSFGDAYGRGRQSGLADGLKCGAKDSPEALDIDAEARRVLGNDRGFQPSHGRRVDYDRGFRDGFELGFCQAFASRGGRARRVWDPGLGRYREEKPGRVWDPGLGRYREEKPGQVWDPGLGRYRDRDPQRDGTVTGDPPPPGRHRHAGERRWCTEKH